MTDLDKLKNMYANTSKHSNYQVLASELYHYLAKGDIDVRSRNEHIRLEFFLKNVNLKNKKILDIGGNTGYFTFEALRHGASKVDYYEGNDSHSKFVKLSSEILNYTDNINIYNEYYHFNKAHNYDVVFLLNVLHHIGDDFGNGRLSKEKALEAIIEHMKFIAKQTNILVFQLGFNWKGDCKLPLFENGTKKELIDFIISSLESEYEIVKIGIAERIDEDITYNDLNDMNIIRDDSLGEFLNRPIFIMKSKCK